MSPAGSPSTNAGRFICKEVGVETLWPRVDNVDPTADWEESKNKC